VGHDAPNKGMQRTRASALLLSTLNGRSPLMPGVRLLCLSKHEAYYPERTIMPGCVLRVSGVNFQPDRFLAASVFVPCNVFRKSERKAQGRVWDSSGFIVAVSEASGDDFARQVRDAVEFLQKHEEELARLMEYAGLEDVRLDFGVGRKNGFLQSNYLPPALLELAGALGIGVEISIYGADEN
jgi:hypothetical protein